MDLDRSALFVTSQDIKEAEEHLRILKEAKQDQDKWHPAKKAAVILHASFCNGDHDAANCDWQAEFKEEIHQWREPAHDYWYNKALQLIGAGFTVDDIFNFAQCMRRD